QTGFASSRKSLQASQVATETAQIYDSEAMLVISSSLNLGGLG
ncbi:MAG: hypothetical protein ACI8WM_002292, partial [Burkholderiaceae bacterium]